MWASFFTFQKDPPLFRPGLEHNKNFPNDFLLEISRCYDWNEKGFLNLCYHYQGETLPLVYDLGEWQSMSQSLKLTPKKLCSKREMSKAIYQFTNMCLNFSMHSELDICPPPFTPQADEFKANDKNSIVLRWLFLQRKDHYIDPRGGEFGYIK